MKQYGKLYYGWIVVLGCFLICAIPMIFAYNYWSFYQMPVCMELECSYVQFNLAATLGSFVSMVFSLLLAGKFSQGKTPLYMMLLAVISGGTWITMSYSTNVWMIVFEYAIHCFCATGMYMLPINVLISNWFVDKKGMATSLAFLGQGIGGAIFSPVMARMIESSGWRASMRMGGIICIASFWIIVPLLIRKTPAEKGLDPFVLPKKEGQNTKGIEQPVWEGISKKDAVKSIAFWLSAVAVLCCGMIAAGVMNQIPTYLIEQNIAYESVMSVYAIAGIFSMLLMGPLYDKIGLSKGILCSAISLIVSLILIILAKEQSSFAYIGIFIFAFGSAAGSLVPPLLTGNLFGMKDYSSLYGMANVFFMGGCMIGPLAAAAIRSALGAYDMAWVMFIAASALIFVTAALALKLSATQKETE